jgi:GntR family transcriptional regulator/MocR family aminotransferase
MVLPATLTPGVSLAISNTGHVAPLLLQAAVFDFINEGHLAKHLRRMRRLYATRREVFHSLCQDMLSEWLELSPGQSGIQTAAFCRGDLNDHEIAAAAKRRGINIAPLSMQFRHGNPRQGLVLGYAATPVGQMASRMEKLRAAFVEVASSCV